MPQVSLPVLHPIHTSSHRFSGVMPATLFLLRFLESVIPVVVPPPIFAFEDGAEARVTGGWSGGLLLFGSLLSLEVLPWLLDVVAAVSLVKGSTAGSLRSSSSEEEGEETWLLLLLWDVPGDDAASSFSCIS